MGQIKPSLPGPKEYSLLITVGLFSWRRIMRFFGKLGRKNRQPDEEALLSENLIISLWIEPSESGPPRINYRLGRVHPKDSTKRLGTLRVCDLFEIPEAVGNLAHVLSSIEGIPVEEQTLLKRFASAMEAVSKVVKSNGLDEEAKPAQPFGSILKRQAA